MRRFPAVLFVLAACHSEPPKSEAPPANANVPAPPSGSATASADGVPMVPGDEKAPPDVRKERHDFIADVMAFTKLPGDQVVAKLVTNTGMKQEWEAWEGSGAMTDDRIKQFYKQTQNYIFDLGGWHLWDLQKRESDLAMPDELRKLLPDELRKPDAKPRVLDFGGGVGFNSLVLAKAGFDVTLADLDSVTLSFAKFRAERQGVQMKYWKSDVEEMPPDAKYDVIICMDVFEHLPDSEIVKYVDKLVTLKTKTTQIIIHAPFGRTAQHPMHLDQTEVSKHQIARLQNELPADAK
ncbi:MAG TPA: class I SAM-dependent methyltransferase [Kofleriaceae bacterium]|nr:class I SAM-dependent methyltransferase [Kofleriaceae bacterium]